jgi:hypothetical protein
LCTICIKTGRGSNSLSDNRYNTTSQKKQAKQKKKVLAGSDGGEFFEITDFQDSSSIIINALNPGATGAASK